MRVLVAAFIFVSVPCGLPAKAQLMLHNGPEGAPAAGGESVPAGSHATPEAKAKPIPMKPPGEDSVLDHDLLRDGAVGVISLVRQGGKDVGVAKLSFEGEAISKPGELCHVDINSGLPITAHFEGRPGGLSRYRVDLGACPFSFDVLEGAILVPKGHACDFTEADCHVDPAGLWGPQGNTISATRVKEMEQARVRLGSDMVANYHVLLSRAGKDKFAMKRIAGEQAGFSSERETLCHSYALESVHGFCALEVTRARVLALLAQLGAVSDKQEEAKPLSKKKPRPPSVAAEPAPAPGPQ